MEEKDSKTVGSDVTAEKSSHSQHSHHKHRRHHKRHRSPAWRIVGGLLVAVQIVVTVMVIISLIKTSILDPLWMLLVLFVLISLTILNFTHLVVHKHSATSVRIVCMTLSVICIAGCAWTLRYTSALNNFLDRVSYSSSQTNGGESDKKLMEEPFLVYISGSDSRNGIEEKARSDVNILAAVNPKQGKILLVSIPRDTYVQLHGTEGLKDKLTHAGVYGINMSKETIEDFLGVDIDHTVKVSFDTVVKVVDELDGIDIDSDQAMTLKAENGETCKFVEGKQHIDGACALRFSRERKSYETGDRHRGENQQQVITSIINRLSGSDKYVMKLPEILDVAADSFETTFKRDDISAYIRSLLGNKIDWKVESIAVDGTGAMEPTYSMGSQPLYVMIPDEATVQNAQNKIKQYLGLDN